jgi:hypothetical protein
MNLLAQTIKQEPILTPEHTQYKPRIPNLPARLQKNQTLAKHLLDFAKGTAKVSVNAAPGPGYLVTHKFLGETLPRPLGFQTYLQGGEEPRLAPLAPRRALHLASKDKQQ